MIRSLHLTNFKCLRDVTVELKPLTVLIGKNDTGKSSLLDAVHYLAQLSNGNTKFFHGPRSLARIAWRGADPPVVGWNVVVDPTQRNALPGRTEYGLQVAPLVDHLDGMRVVSESIAVTGSSAAITIDGDEAGRDRQTIQEGDSKNVITAKQHKRLHHSGLAAVRQLPGFTILRSVGGALSSTIKYKLDPERISRPSAYTPEEDFPDQAPRLEPDGQGLPSVLDYLLGTKRAVFQTIEDELRKAVPGIKHIQLKPARIIEDARSAQAPVERPGKALWFELSPNGHGIPAPLASDGVLLFLAYLTLVYSPDVPAVLLLEEPENGVHPRQLERVMGYLRRLTEDGASPGGSQVLVATHSPYLLDYVAPESVLVFGRRANGESVVAPLTSLPGVSERIKAGLTLGEMWYNVGEDRLLGDLLNAPPAGG